MGSYNAHFPPHFGTATDFSPMAHRPSVIRQILAPAAAAFWGLSPLQKAGKGFPGLQLCGKARIALALFQHRAPLCCSQQGPGRAFGSIQKWCRDLGCAPTPLKSPAELQSFPHSSVLPVLAFHCLPPNPVKVCRTGTGMHGCVNTQRENSPQKRSSCFPRTNLSCAPTQDRAQ